MIEIRLRLVRIGDGEIVLHLLDRFSMRLLISIIRMMQSERQMLLQHWVEKWWLQKTQRRSELDETILLEFIRLNRLQLEERRDILCSSIITSTRSLCLREERSQNDRA